MKNIRVRLIPSPALLILLLSLLVGLTVVLAGVSTHAHAHPASTITVTNCSTEDSSPGTLGNAIGSASPGDTINFNCSGTIPIATTLELKISMDNLTLDGGGKVTLEGQNVRVLSVDSNVTFTLKALTIAKGSSGVTNEGGGLFADTGSTVNISNSTFTGNSASGFGGGLFVDTGSTVKIANSTFTGNSASGFDGGGLFNEGTVTISNSTFDQNTATNGEGGGLENSNTVSISNSTFASNTANVGGGLEIAAGTVSISNSTFASNTASGQGGGIQIAAGTVNISNNTFANNTVGGQGGGIENATGTVNISNSTFANNTAPNGNGGDLDNPGTGALNIKASIVANNTGGNCFGRVTSRDYNLDNTNTCGFSTTTNDLVNTNPQLDTAGLANNGGPTQTIALQQDSPAIDHVPTGSGLCLATDQRGVSRPDDTEASCDIGAYESTFVDNDLSLSGLPADITTDATSPQGAVVTYTAPTAVDESGDSPGPSSVNCTPASGSTFPIGTTTVPTTTVTCTVTDSDDSNSPFGQSFTVTVKGAADQVNDLITLVNSFNLSLQGIQTSFDSQLQAVQADLAANNTAQACSDLTSFINHVKAQSGQHLTADQANQMLTAATRIQAVLAC